jgi:hypothetical protein
MLSRMNRFVPAFAVCLALTAAAACGERARGGTTAVSVTEIDLGRSLKPDLTIDDKSNDFRATDVIYTSIATKGSGRATLKARWMFEDSTVVAEDMQEIAPTGPARTEFHLSRPTGLPSGHYRLEVSLNGTPVETKTFEIH